MITGALTYFPEALQENHALTLIGGFFKYYPQRVMLSKLKYTFIQTTTGLEYLFPKIDPCNILEIPVISDTNIEFFYLDEIGQAVIV